MAKNLTDQVRAIAKVTSAVAAGDLSQTIDVDAEGEILVLKETVNGMVDQLRKFSAEVTRVALEVGTEGMLGGSAYVENVEGTWKVGSGRLPRRRSRLIVTAALNGQCQSNGR